MMRLRGILVATAMGWASSPFCPSQGVAEPQRGDSRLTVLQDGQAAGALAREVLVKLVRAAYGTPGGPIDEPGAIVASREGKTKFGQIAFGIRSDGRPFVVLKCKATATRNEKLAFQVGHGTAETMVLEGVDFKYPLTDQRLFTSSAGEPDVIEILIFKVNSTGAPLGTEWDWIRIRREMFPRGARFPGNG